MELIMRPPKGLQQMKFVRDWNAKHAVGVAVHVRTADGGVVASKTRSEAWLLGGHTAVILVEGFSGGMMLSRVSTIPL